MGRSSSSCASTSAKRFIQQSVFTQKDTFIQKDTSAITRPRAERWLPGEYCRQELFVAAQKSAPCPNWCMAQMNNDDKKGLTDLVIHLQ
jgi:hypothetical protein